MEMNERKSSSRKSSSSSASHDDVIKGNIEPLIIRPDVSAKESSSQQDHLDIKYKIDDVPPWYLCIFLGFQHYLTMFGSNASIAWVVAPKLCLDIHSVEASEILSSLFFVSGIVTLIQSTVGVRLPIVQGGTFAFLVPTFAILSLPKWACPDTSDTIANCTLGENMTDTYNTIENMTHACNTTEGPPLDDEVWQSRMREVQGAIITASCVQVLVGVTGITGFVMRYIGPITITPTIALIGMALFDVAADTCAYHWGIAILCMALITLFSQYLRNVDIPVFYAHKPKEGKVTCQKTTYPLFKMFPVILGIVLSWIFCWILTATDVFKNDENSAGYYARTDLNLDVIYQANWFRFPYPFQWGLPTFTLAGTIGMIAGVIAGMLESVGDYYACARLCGAPPPPTHAINRGIAIEGIGCIISGMFGTGTGTTSYSENVGAIGITKVGSRRVIQTAALVMMILGVFSKFGALFVTIPSPIVGGVFMVMFGMITAVGVSNLQYVDLNSSRNLFIFGFSVLFGLSVPKWLKANPNVIDSGNEVLDQVITVMLSTSMFLGGTLAFILDNTVPGTLEERGIDQWRSQIVENDDDDNAETTAAKAASKCYEIPYMSKTIRKHHWLSYLPFCPTFRGYHCKCRCCKKCQKRSYSVTSDDETGSNVENIKYS